MEARAAAGVRREEFGLVLHAGGVRRDGDGLSGGPGALEATWARETSSGAKRTRIRSAVSAGVSASQLRRRTPGSACMGTEV